MRKGFSKQVTDEPQGSNNFLRTSMYKARKPCMTYVQSYQNFEVSVYKTDRKNCEMYMSDFSAWYHDFCPWN